MEPESEKMIRTKVLEADAMVISWQRDRVWGRITRDPQPASYSRLWSAAAAILITVAMVAFLVYTQQQRTAERISELEEAIRNLPLVTLQETVSGEVPCPLKKIVIRATDKKLTTIRATSPKETPVLTLSVVALPEAPLETIVADEPVNVSEPNASQPTMVKAIIGKVPVSSGLILTRREMRFLKRKIQILPFNNFDTTPVVAQEETFTARLH